MKNVVFVTLRYNIIKNVQACSILIVATWMINILKALHVQFEDGKELIGVRAFIYVWNNTNGYKWLGKLIGLPIIFQLSQLLYAVIARLLFWRFKIFN